MSEATLTRALCRAALFAVALIAGVLLVIALEGVLVQLFVAMIVAAGMAPLVARLCDARGEIARRWTPPRALAVVLVYVACGLALFVVGALTLHAIGNEGAVLLVKVPEFTSAVQAWIDTQVGTHPLLAQLGLGNLSGGLFTIEQGTLSILPQLLTAASLLVSVFGGAISVLFVLFMALYLSVDYNRMLAYLVVFVPEQRQPQARRVTRQIASRLGQWVSGQLLFSLLTGLGAWLGLAVSGVPGAALLGVIWAVAEFIPGIGPFISAVPSIALGFSAGPTSGLLATVFSVVWSQVANNVLMPRVMSRAVKLNPLVVLLALLVGSELLGLMGALISIPAAAALAVVIDELRAERVAALGRSDEPTNLAVVDGRRGA
jgi:predicted PurR-regulated permease PerM